MQNSTETQAQTQNANNNIFAILNAANAANHAKVHEKELLEQGKDVAKNTISIVTGVVESVALTMELTNNYLKEAIDAQRGSRTTTQVDSVIEQLTAATRLTQLGCSNQDAIALATSFRL